MGKLQLVIDQGNTAIKAALFKDKVLIKHVVATGSEALSVIQKLINEGPERAILSSVRTIESQDLGLEKKFALNKNYFLLDATSPLPIKNEYSSPATLGNDRLCNAVGAFTLFPNENSLVIDAGTCLKFDFISKENTYLGGSIAPGYQMRFKALNTYTDKLPLVESQLPKDLIGNTTEESIRTGVYFGMLNEIEGMIDQYQKKYEHLNCIITGGDAEVFAKALKNPIFADPFLTLKGLNTILEQYA